MYAKKGDQVEMWTLAQAKEFQTKETIKFIIQDKKCSFGDAAKLWYNSKTKKEMQDSVEDLTWVSPARCYDELLMELSGDEHWMRGSFL